MSGALYRLGRFAARHRILVLILWVFVAAGCVALARILGARVNNTLTLPGTDSQAATDILAERFPPQQNGTSPLVLHVGDGKLTDPPYKRAIDRTYRRFKSSPSVHSVLNPVGKDAQAAGIISSDGAYGFMPILLNVGSGFITENLAEGLLDTTKPARAAGIEVAIGGPIGSVLSQPDTETSQRLGNISAMVILALVFGSLVAMGLPIISAAFGLAVASSVIGLLGHLIAVPTVAPTLAVMIGLGVGIDYALFLITRHKETLDGGVDVRESVARSVSTSGSAIVFAGGTVVIALVSLSVAGIPLVSTLGFASAIAVFAAVATSITLLPAILSLVGHGIDRLRLPRFLRMKKRAPGSRRWDAWARWVARHPWIAVGISLLILLPLTIPLFSLELGQPDIGVTPTSTTQRQAYDMMTKGFGVGYNGPLLLAMSLDPGAAPSAKYTKKYNRATSLQRELEREQKRLDAQQRRLEQRQRELEREGAALERRGASLEQQQASLERRAAQLRSQAVLLEQRALRVARKIAPLAGRLALIIIRERRIEAEIADSTDPDRTARLERRLARLERLEAVVRTRLQPLIERERAFRARGGQLLQEAERLGDEGEQLLSEAAALRQQADRLQAQGDQLEEQADELRAEADRAKQQKRQALRLQNQLTAMLTMAGGDPRGTDPRIVHLQTAVGDTSNVVAVSPPQINKPGDAAIMNGIPREAPSSDATATLVTVLRDQTLPPVTGSNGLTVHVGGTTATNVDLARKISSRMLVVIATVLALSFVLLLVAFRSLLIPLQAGLTNLLTVGAALGVLTACFQWGWGLSLIGLDAPGDTVPIASYVPLMMFAVLFGLSMDYEVFMVSQIQQHHAEGEDPGSAVSSGLGSAGHVTTAAATIMFVVFASFIINGDPTIKQFGVGLSVAVLLAGTMVVLLAPALLRLFGRGLFRIPKVLDRVLPHLDVEGGPKEKAAPRPVPAAPAGSPSSRGSRQA